MTFIREMHVGDFEAVATVSRRNGLAPGGRDEWLRFWEENPFRGELGGLPMGWVIDDGTGKVVGTLRNIPMVYELDGRRLRTAAASSWAVDSSHRGHSLALVARFFGQDGIDLLLNTSANVTASKVCEAFGCRRVTNPSLGRVDFWITRYRGFAGAMLWSFKVPAAGALKYPLAAALAAFDRVKGRVRCPKSGYVLRSVRAFDVWFDEFWERLRQEAGTIRAVRNRASLSWRFQPALDRGEGTVLVLEDGTGPAGYLIAVRRDKEDVGLKRLQVADFQALQNDDGRIRALFCGTLGLARDGVDLVEVIGLCASKRGILAKAKPLRRTMQDWLFYFKAREKSLTDRLGDGAWDPTLFDGDALL